MKEIPLQAAEPPKYVIKPISMARYVPDLTARHVIDGMLYRGEVSVLYGPSNSGKSAVVIRLAQSVASGERVLGAEVQKGGVIYVAAEAPLSVRSRAHLILPEDDARDRFLVVAGRPNLSDDEYVRTLIAAGREAMSRFTVPLALIVFDTGARSFGGADENSNEQMTRVIDRANEIAVTLNVHVMIVHHTGKEGDRGARSGVSIPIPLLVAAGDWGPSKIKRKSCGINLSRINGPKIYEDSEMTRKAHYRDDQVEAIVNELHPKFEGQEIPASAVADVLEQLHGITGVNRQALSAKVKQFRDQIISREEDDLVSALDEADDARIEHLGRVFIHDTKVLFARRAIALRSRTADTLEDLRRKLAGVSDARDLALDEIASLKKELAVASAELAERDRLLDAKNAELLAMAGEIRAYTTVLSHLNRAAQGPEQVV